jgi:hypothetical protein
MRAGIVDVTDWQITLNLEDGRPAEVESPLADLAKGIVAAHPFPGDLDIDSARWVVDVAMELIAGHDPDFAMLVLTNPFFSGVYQPTSDGEYAELVGKLFQQIDRFVDESGFTPVVIGLGGLVPYAGFVDLTDTDGLGMGLHACAYGGLYGSSEADLATLGRTEGVKKIIDRESFRREFGGRDSFYSRFPDHLLVAQDGYYFRGLGTNARPVYRTPKLERQLPLATKLGNPGTLTSVSDMVLDALRDRKVALILVEGLGMDAFPRPFTPISNQHGWFCYPTGEHQYLAITAGQQLVESSYPPILKHYVEDDEDKPYPLSGFYAEMPTRTIAQRSGRRSVAVGNRGMWTHLCSGVDIAIEGFARVLYNHGVMAMVNTDSR